MSSYAMHVIYMGQLSHVVLASLILHGVQYWATSCFLFTFQDFRTCQGICLFVQRACLRNVNDLASELVLELWSYFVRHRFFLFKLPESVSLCWKPWILFFKMATWRILWSCIICAWSWFYDFTLCFNKFIYIAFQDVLRDQDVWQI